MTDQKKAVSEYFNSNVNSWTERYQKPDFESSSYQDRMNSALSLLRTYGQNGSIVWDAGCGAGVLTQELTNHDYQVFACDISPEMATKTLKSINKDLVKKTNNAVFVTDLEKQAVRDSLFDAIISLGVIGYSDHQNDVIKAFSKTLNPGGILIISIATEKRLNEIASDFLSYIPDQIYMSIKRLFGQSSPNSATYDSGFYKSHYHYSTKREFDNLLSENGLQKLDSKSVNFGRFHFMGKRFLPESLEVYINRIQTSISSYYGFRWLQSYSRIYVGCYIKPEN